MIELIKEFIDCFEWDYNEIPMDQSRNGGVEATNLIKQKTNKRDA